MYLNLGLSLLVTPISISDGLKSADKTDDKAVIATYTELSMIQHFRPGQMQGCNTAKIMHTLGCILIQWNLSIVVTIGMGNEALAIIEGWSYLCFFLPKKIIIKMQLGSRRVAVIDSVAAHQARGGR
jgi:hypothetical protein